MPRKLQKKILKRKKKRDELRMQRKFKIDWTKSDDVILERYREVFPDQSDDKLRENIRYQKLIFNKTSAPSEKKKSKAAPN